MNARTRCNRRSALTGLAGTCLRLGFKLRDQRFEFRLVEELQLRVRNTLGTGAEALAPQQLDGLQELFDALLVALEGLRLGLDFLPQDPMLTLRIRQPIGQLTDDPTESGRVVGKEVSGALHGHYYSGFSV